MSKGNRNMAAKAVKAKRQAREFFHMESTKSTYLLATRATLPLASVDGIETFNGKPVLHVPAGLKGRKGVEFANTVRAVEQRQRLRAHWS